MTGRLEAEVMAAICDLEAWSVEHVVEAASNGAGGRAAALAPAVSVVTDGRGRHRGAMCMAWALFVNFELASEGGRSRQCSTSTGTVRRFPDVL
jgi:hypothetical protein